jgi:hypothetical protein
MAEIMTSSPRAVEDAEVKIIFTPLPAVEITIDRSKLTWKDFLDIQTLTGISNEQALAQFSNIMQKVTGLDINTLPAYQVGKIIQALSTMVTGAEIKN